MIRFFTKSNPARESLVGKIVLHEGNNLFAGYSTPRLVISESAKSYVGRELSRKMEDGKVVFTGVRNDGEDSTFRLASVACVCDTVADLNIVADMNAKVRAHYQAAIADGVTMFAELEAVEARIEPETQARGPRP